MKSRAASRAERKPAIRLILALEERLWPGELLTVPTISQDLFLMFADARKCVFFEIEINSLGKHSSVKAQEVGLRSIAFSAEFTPANMPWRGVCEHTSIIVRTLSQPT
jgi:hypothetical protein